MNKNFEKEVNAYFQTQRELAARGRRIIKDFVNAHGGRYTFDNENDDYIWVGPSYAEALVKDGEWIRVEGSECFSVWLHAIPDSDVLDLAQYAASHA